MKIPSIVLASLVLLVSPVFAELGEKQFERAKSTAASQGKLIAFHFEQGYWDPKCPKCITSVDSKNDLVKKAIPRKHVTVVSVDPKEKVETDKLPDFVASASKNRPCIVIVSADGTKLIGTLGGSATKEEIKALEKKAAEALLK